MNKPAAMTDWELEWMARVISTLPRREAYLEIGSLMGGSLLYFGRLMEKGAKLISVDIGETTGLHKARETLSAEGFQVYTFVGDSRHENTVREIRKLAGEILDVLFIDGDHSLTGVVLDIENYAGLVRKGGVVMFHDCGLGGPCAEEHKGKGMHPYKKIRIVHGAFQSFAFGRRYLLCQDAWGLGAVWM